MQEFLTWAVGGILFVLGGLHAYWAIGGRGGHEAVIPNTGKAALFKPSRMATVTVALLLALAAWSVLELGGVGHGLFSDQVVAFGGWLLSGLFIIRAIGDFRWLGFFKRRKGTLFAKWDSLLYSPLCLLLGAALLTIDFLRMG